MTKGLIVAAGVAASCVWLAVGLGGTAAGGTESRIEPQVMLDTAGGRQASFVIRLRDRADLTAAYRIKNQDARGRYVYRALRRTAARTQAADPRSAGLAWRLVQVVLGRERDRRKRRQVARRGPGCTPGRGGDRVESQLELAPERGAELRLGPLAAGGRARRQPGARARPLGARLHGAGHRRGRPGHRHPLDARRAQAPLPRLERLDRRPQLQLVGRNSQRRRSLRAEPPGAL